MNAIKILIFKQNNVSMYCNTKCTQEWMKCLSCMPTTKMSSNKGKVPANLEKDVCVYF